MPYDLVSKHHPEPPPGELILILEGPLDQGSEETRKDGRRPYDASENSGGLVRVSRQCSGAGSGQSAQASLTLLLIGWQPEKKTATNSNGPASQPR